MTFHRINMRVILCKILYCRACIGYNHVLMYVIDFNNGTNGLAIIIERHYLVVTLLCSLLYNVSSNCSFCCVDPKVPKYALVLSVENKEFLRNCETPQTATSSEVSDYVHILRCTVRKLVSCIQFCFLNL